MMMNKHKVLQQQHVTGNNVAVLDKVALAWGRIRRGGGTGSNSTPGNEGGLSISAMINKPSSSNVSLHPLADTRRKRAATESLMVLLMIHANMCFVWLMTIADDR